VAATTGGGAAAWGCATATAAGRDGATAAGAAAAAATVSSGGGGGIEGRAFSTVSATAGMAAGLSLSELPEASQMMAPMTTTAPPAAAKSFVFGFLTVA
jgi:hypothetical protein